ncbi:hypothetical protein RUE5091_03349 [Ruegeria denitrificans]|uniref:Gluconolactonase n=1 Tax=Ruegeria denitrificans TaxID=1715692 RepID=A0A0P1IG65_9RHOB|nr:hypothetical protein [Ruegeria denitrificans]CUK10879.1 hypothetical protein RUE5091_03349 [Ruegeria denitrificans]
MLSVLNLCRAFTIAGFGLLLGCTDYAYVGMPPGQPSREIKIPDGSTRLIPISSSIVGLAYDDARERIFLRNLPGTQLQELDRDGRVLRTFSAQRVPAGCGGFTPDEFPIKECGLAVRESDGHLFLDHPNGLMISELTRDGQFVRNIRIGQPQGPIGGVAFDENTKTLYILFIRNRLIAEIDLNGNTKRIIRATNPAVGAALQIERFGLGINSDRRELYVALQNGNRLGVLNMSGGLIATHNLSAGVAVEGIGGGRVFGL